MVFGDMKLHDLDLAIYRVVLFNKSLCLGKSCSPEPHIYRYALFQKSPTCSIACVHRRQILTDKSRWAQNIVKKGTTHSKELLVHCTVEFATHLSHPKSYCLATSPILGVVKFNVVEHKTHGQCTMWLDCVYMWISSNKSATNMGQQ